MTNDYGKWDKILADLKMAMKERYRNRKYLSKKLHISAKKLNAFLDKKAYDDMVATALESWIENGA